MQRIFTHACFALQNPKRNSVSQILRIGKHRLPQKKNVRARKIQKQVFIITVAKLSPSSQVAGKIDFVVNTYSDKKQLQICDSKSGQPFPYMFPTRDITV